MIKMAHSYGHTKLCHTNATSQIRQIRSLIVMVILLEMKLSERLWLQAWKCMIKCFSEFVN